MKQGVNVMYHCSDCMFFNSGVCKHDMIDRITTGGNTICVEFEGTCIENGTL